MTKEQAAKRLLEMALSEWGDPDDPVNADDDGAIGWNGDGSEIDITFKDLREIKRAILSPSETIAALECLLSRGLDLCVRAQRIDQLWEMGEDGVRVRCATPSLWTAEQYDRDLEQWETDVRQYLREHGQSVNVLKTLSTQETIRREIDA